MTTEKTESKAKTKTYYATDSIGHSLKTGQPEFKKGDKITATHAQLAKWIKWGMVAEEKPKEDNDGEHKRPRSLPVFPIKKDISSAKRPQDDEDDAQTRTDAEGLLSPEQADKQENSSSLEFLKASNRMTKDEKAEAKEPEIKIERADDDDEGDENPADAIEGDEAGSEDDTGVRGSATDDTEGDNARNVDPEPHGDSNLKIKPKKVKTSDKN